MRNEVRTFVHSEDGGEGFLGMIQGAVSVVKDADAIPQFWVLLGMGRGLLAVNARRCEAKKGKGVAYLWIGQEVESLLIGSVGLLEVVLHEVAVPWGPV